MCQRITTFAIIAIALMLITDGDNNTSVEHYKVIDGGHVWFDIGYDGSNTSRLIWNFVSRYDIHGTN